METSGKTAHTYQHQGHLRTHTTKISSIQLIEALPDGERALYKNDLSPVPSPQIYAIVTESSIFYPQGGGQPSDVGTFKSASGDTTFNVLIARNAPDRKRILHFGHYASEEERKFEAGNTAHQEIDSKKRLLYSRIHTAGHILGLAVGRLPDLIPDVVDTKAQHYPESAWVEFKGLIDGKHQAAIQEQADKLVAEKRRVLLHWWHMDELHEKCAAVLDGFSVPEGEKARAVEIEGVGAYPCGGTHVHESSEVGKIVVGRIKRKKGMTTISYSVVPNE
ncbi:Threonyl/alanyl tRNA synthetase [Bisporella sp. PMI_857]|nr:Threonyl/alanyl tRNA synthetase [Bisporella sp. PMI_857]